MNWDQMAGNWMDNRDSVRERWGKLTDQDLVRIGGKREELIMVLAERYGWPREQVERQVKDFEQSSEDVASTPSGQSAGRWSGEESVKDSGEESVKDEEENEDARMSKGPQSGRPGSSGPPGQRQYGQGERDRKST